MTTRWTFAVAGLLLGMGAVAGAEGVQRYALVTGANEGGRDRATLRFAVSDAKRFAAVLQELGGVLEQNTVLLEQPTVESLEEALETLRQRTLTDSEGSTGTPRRTEFLFYYSGHADEKGLLLGDDRYSYRSLRDQMDAVPADVRIAVLDACASGAITRMKGGRVRPPFLADESSDMRGHAFLTSSSEDEVAQESEGLGGSFFTHYLTSGLRGAADVSGEGKVTLNEAYQFAFHETLGGTADTRGGAQHPAYDIQLSGTGDVVMTDVRQTSAGLVLSKELKGRCFVRNADEQLVVELRKPQGRTVRLGLEPGTYRINCDVETGAVAASTQVAEGAQVVVGPEDFTPTGIQPTTARGGSDTPPGKRPLDGRHRIDLKFSFSTHGDNSNRLEPGALVVTSAEGVGGGIDFYHWFNEGLALNISSTSLTADTALRTGEFGIQVDSTNVTSLLAGVRWYPWSTGTSTVRPHFTGLVGPYFATGASFSTGSASTRTRLAPGIYLGGGVDFRVGDRVMLGVNVGADLMTDFSDPIGGTKDYRAFQMSFSFGWVWGKGRTPTP